jgi:hypothetical protein
MPVKSDRRTGSNPGRRQTFTKELADVRIETGHDFSSSVDKGMPNCRSLQSAFLEYEHRCKSQVQRFTNAVDLDVRVQPGQFALVQARGFDINGELRDRSNL